MYLLGYDVGSSSVKASLVDAQSGKCIASTFYPKSEAAIIAVKPGWAEQEPDSWWENLKLATADVLSASGIRPDDIKAIGYECPASFDNMVRFTCCRLWTEGI